MTRLETLHTNLLAAFGESATLTLALNELTLEVPAKDWVDACTALRDNADLGFDMCVDLCGIDYSAWGRSEEHTSELQSLMRISYAVFCLKKNKKKYKL